MTAGFAAAAPGREIRLAASVRLPASSVLPEMVMLALSNRRAWLAPPLCDKVEAAADEAGRH